MKLEKLFPEVGPNNKGSKNLRATRRRTRALRQKCAEPDVFERMYGRTNIRMSRGYEGSLFRTEQFVIKILRGEPVTFSAIGGSVTSGHNVQQFEAWVTIFGDWLRDWFPHDGLITIINGAVPATGSGYFAFCFPLHIPEDSDLVVVELGVNDEPDLEMIDNMESLLRGVLGMKNSPSVMLAEAMAFSKGPMSGGGGRFHLPVAQYYDVPVINQRHPLVNHFARFPEVVPMYFSESWDQPDLRHFNWHGHRDLANLVASLLRDVACELVADPHYMPPPPDTQPPGVQEHTPQESFNDQVTALYGEDTRHVLRKMEEDWPEEARSWLYQPPAPKQRKRDDVQASARSEGDAEEGASPQEEPPLPQQVWMPGFWSRPAELGMLPRINGMEGWNADVSHRVPEFHPTCKSTHSDKTEFQLRPIHMDPQWDYWVHPENSEKPYYVSKVPGAKVKFEIGTSVGIVKIYSLFAQDLGFGKCKCWVDNAKDVGKIIDGRLGNADNTGQLTTLSTIIPAGTHNVTCEILEETNDPNGGHEFRIIGVMGG
ncbi:uncharacterized protein CcaverHIS019_0509460 [Cutaneotrichosporon cavernicola]|uniref:SGNH hydrolase-type esterase domain-containing protein n=1 Tax=Cutaneotrichosporon cavernicola TaxID=279322 RepID=A0AA48QXF9_9TREE|nr:uncharacterized protein CcaverHIS019_0509460 [Cutaneotrichosporon cavernicola]BEI93318.1 hypothetical protein CcaverHIS019_0509460 [Cutaneotrichosporon cavernicola]BEJ01096.1 hypothetical protein CcaverHIS631_0509530 [Cutaneotrichosporon cavernicola]BEJ08864.1 hypothetical protein CcaverHIS641_0509580 [Cutaneotrichosporon cavernicola]